jgi:hypothetical protein
MERDDIVNVRAALITINQASYDALASSSLELYQANQVIPEALLRKHQTSHLPIDLTIDTLLGAGGSKGNTKASHQLQNQSKHQKELNTEIWNRRQETALANLGCYWICQSARDLWHSNARRDVLSESGYIRQREVRYSRRGLASC